MLIKELLLEGKPTSKEDVGRWNSELVSKTDAEFLHTMRSNGVPHDKWKDYAKTYAVMTKKDDGSYVRFSDYAKLWDEFHSLKISTDRKLRTAANMIRDLKKKA